MCCPALLAACGNHSGEAERASGIGLKLFGFIPEPVFTFIPESCSRSSRNTVRNHPGIAFTLPRIPHRARRDEHFVLGRRFLATKGSGLYKLDLLAIAVLDRSLALLRGFCDLVERRNMIAAAPLLRCQLDNGLRFFAPSLTADPHECAEKVASGIAMRKIEDRSGKRMVDSYLVDQLTVQVSWVKSLYAQASGYVHFSEQHIFNTVGIPDHEGITTIGITGQDGSVWTEQRYLEAIEAFNYSTSLVLELVEQWSQARGTPPTVVVST